MQVGINYPWQTYDWDFGDLPRDQNNEPVEPSKGAWKPRISTVLTSFSQLGIFAVRWFILCSGLAFGTGADAPTSSASGWKVQAVPNLAKPVVEDFRALLEAFAKATPLKIMPVFVNYQMFLDPDPPPKPPARRLGPGYVKGGRYQLINHPEKRTAFLQKALQPLLDVAQPYKCAIYAFDLINEPELCVRNPGKAASGCSYSAGSEPGGEGRVERKHMVSFLREGVTMINKADLKSSIGFFNRAGIDEWKSFGLNVRLHQFHYYSNPAEVPRHEFDQHYPLIVGEFASAPHKGWPDLRATEQTHPGHDIVYNRLRHLASKGYPAAFIWSAELKPDPPKEGEPQSVDWRSGTQGQVQRFTSGQR